MSKRWNGNLLVTSNPNTPTYVPGFYTTGTTGNWSTMQQCAYKSVGIWPKPVTPYIPFSIGKNNYGQTMIGSNSPIALSSPVIVGSSLYTTSWKNIATTGLSTLAVKTDGTLWGVGLNGAGQLGLGNTTTYSSPKQVGALTNWASVAITSTNTSGANARAFGVKTDGTLWTWGTSASASGLGAGTSTTSPLQVGALTNWAQISCAKYHTLAIKTDGTLWAWGSGGITGALGLGNTADYSSPKQVGALTNWASVIANNTQTFAGGSRAIKTDGTLWAWGAGDNGSSGLGNTTNYSSPKQVGALNNWATISAQFTSVVAVKTDKTIWSWGDNSTGQLGLGDTANRSSPTQIGTQGTWNRAVMGQGLYSGPYDIASGHCVAVKIDGTLWTWGNNTSGQLGLGNTTSYSSPKQVGSGNRWKIPVAGKFLTLALKG